MHEGLFLSLTATVYDNPDQCYKNILITPITYTIKKVIISGTTDMKQSKLNEEHFKGFLCGGHTQQCAQVPSIVHFPQLKVAAYRISKYH